MQVGGGLRKGGVGLREGRAAGGAGCRRGGAGRGGLCEGEKFPSRMTLLPKSNLDFTAFPL